MQLLCDGSYRLSEAAELLNPSAPDPAQVLALSHDGKILAFEYGGGLWCPKYQFAGGTVLPVISQLLKVTRDAGATDTELSLWTISASSLFAEQDRPADHLSNAAQVVGAARTHFEAVW